MFLQVAFIAVVVLLVGLTVVLTRKREQEVRENASPFVETGSEEPISIVPSSDGVKSAARPTTPRDQRLEDIKARAKTGLCLYCECRAQKSMPKIVPERGWLNNYLHRRTGSVAMDRYVLSTSASSVSTLCEDHWHIATGLLEKRLTELNSDYTEFADKQRSAVYEFQMFAMDEKLLADAQEVRKGRKSRKAAEAKVTNLKVVNGS